MEIGAVNKAARKRWLVLVESIGDGARLYLSGLSTVEALRLLPPSAGIVVEHLFGESGYGRSPSRYVSQTDLPSTATVETIIRHLLANDDLNLIDFNAKVDGGLALSTHDDGEATFHVASFAEAAKLLEAAVGSDLSAAQRAAVFSDMGRYFLIEGDEVSSFETFEDALASGALDES